MSVAAQGRSRVDGVWFKVTLLYLVIDYGRPQDMVSPDFIRPGLIITLVLVFFLMFSGAILKSRSPQASLMGAFVILLAMHVPLARNNFYAYVSFRTMALMVPFFLSTIICVNSVARLQAFMRVSAAILVYVAIYGLLHGGVGAGGSLHDENDLSLYLIMWMPFGYYLFFFENDWKYKLLYASGIVLGLAAVVVSFSRGGFVGLVAVAVVIWWFSSHKAVMLVGIGIVAGMLFFFGGDVYVDEMSSIADLDESTASQRLMSWEAGFYMFLDHPMGVGGNNFPLRFPDYQPEGFSRNMWGRTAHSIWFTLIPELGIPGIIVYFMLIHANIRSLRFLRAAKGKKDRELLFLSTISLAFWVSLAGFFSSGSFLSVLYYPHYWYVTGLIAATENITRARLLEVNASSA